MSSFRRILDFPDLSSSINIKEVIGTIFIFHKTGKTLGDREADFPLIHTSTEPMH